MMLVDFHPQMPAIESLSLMQLKEAICHHDVNCIRLRTKTSFIHLSAVKIHIDYILCRIRSALLNTIIPFRNFIAQRLEVVI